MQKHRLWSIAILIAVLMTPLARATAVGAEPPVALDSLKRTIDMLLADPRLNGAEAGVLVRRAEDGSVLYSRSPDNRLIPASNDKLYSSTAALEVLGPDYTFDTTVAATGRRDGNTIYGDLFIKGTGDPTMQAADYDKLASEVAAAGIRSIRGCLVADDTFFDRRQLGNNWAWDNNAFSYQPEISALSVAANAQFDIGSLSIHTAAADVAGRAPLITTVPATNYVQIENNATTGPAGSTNTLAVERKLGINTIVVTGSIPANSSQDDLSTVSDPTGYAASLFRSALQRHGVTVAGPTRRDALPAGSRTVTTRKSIPLAQIYSKFLKLSNNGIAEILVKSMGAKGGSQGTWDNGLLAETTAVASGLGVDTSTIQLVDGSGLSNLNFTTPTQSTNLLIGAQRKPWFKGWYEALPIAGQSDRLVGGTLRSRMVGTKAAGNVHAKTGNLVGVSALSGYVTDADGGLLVFSIMTNNYIYGLVRPIEDAIAVTLANFSKSAGVSSAAAAQAKSLAQTAPQPKASQGTSKSDFLECAWVRAGC